MANKQVLKCSDMWSDLFRMQAQERVLLLMYTLCGSCKGMTGRHVNNKRKSGKHLPQDASDQSSDHAIESFEMLACVISNRSVFEYSG